MKPGTRVRVVMREPCPAELAWHGSRLEINGRRGIVLGEAPPTDGEHTVKVGLEWGFSYFRLSELELCGMEA